VNDVKGAGERIVEVTVHCPVHPEPVLHGWSVTDPMWPRLLGSHAFVPDMTDEVGLSPEMRESLLSHENDVSVVYPADSGLPHHHYEINCAELDHHGYRCTTSIRLTEFDTEMEEFTCALWSHNGPSLRFFVLSAFLHDLLAYGTDGLLEILDEFGAERFVAILNRNRSGRYPVCVRS
jgi:hypothetical protein